MPVFSYFVSEQAVIVRNAGFPETLSDIAVLVLKGTTLTSHDDVVSYYCNGLKLTEPK